MQMLIWIVAAALTLLALVAGVRRLPPALTIALLLAVLPVALCFRAKGDDEASIFSLVKLASVVAGAAYFQALRITRWAERPLGRAAVHAILAVNIIEAVVSEAAQGGIVNPAVGVILVLTQAPPSAVRVDRRRDGAEFRYGLGGRWLAAYTAWNFAFIYGRDSHGAKGVFAALAVVHLLVPLLAMRGNGGLYIEARALVLTAVAVLRIVVPHPPLVYPSPGWYAPAVADALHVASVALVTYLAVGALWRPRVAQSRPGMTF
jgi:hypothetical protein